MVQPSNLPNKHSAGGGADTNRLVTQDLDDDDLEGVIIMMMMVVAVVVVVAMTFKISFTLITMKGRGGADAD